MIIDICINCGGVMEPNKEGEIRCKYCGSNKSYQDIWAESNWEGETNVGKKK